MKVNDFQFIVPTKWIHGIDSVRKIGDIVDEYKVKKISIISDKNLIKNNVHESLLKEIEKKVDYYIYDEIMGEPTVSSIDSLAKNNALLENDMFIALGGGSVIDTTKSIRILDEFSGSIREYAGFDKIPEKIKKPLITIPTTSGSGSEISDGAVIIDDVYGTKFAVGGIFNCPTIALTDPTMTVTMPKSVTAVTGVDALVHAVESYITKTASVATELFAIKAVKLLGTNLLKAIEHGNDLSARESMQLGSTMAMISTFNSRLGLCHAFAMPLCGKYGMPHGQACGIVLPEVLEFNYTVQKEKIKIILSKIFEVAVNNDNDVRKAIEKLKTLLINIGVKKDLTELGYNSNDKEDIVEKTMQSFQTQNNPRNVTESDVRNIISQIE